MIRIKSDEECCGCTACVSACDFGAIVMQYDEYGFVFPKVDELKCVECGLCEKVCPIKNQIESSLPLNSYISVAVDKNEQITSTSGGLASVFSRFVITEMGGIVYGCTGYDSHHVRHIRVDKESELSLLKGSKYVQSDMNGIYNQVKDDLKNKHNVLFIGTPCQNAGLVGYLQKKYSTLYCVDFVCHGVPSQKILNDAIDSLNVGKVSSSVSFRYKKNSSGVSKYCLQLKDYSGNVLYKKDYGHDKYISGFLSALFYRDSCYSCKFANPMRVSDITIGDFWDTKKEFSYFTNNKYGLSQMHINTEQGNHLVKMLGDRIFSKSIDFEKLVVHSEQLNNPMPRHNKSYMFFSDYSVMGFEKACKKALRPSMKQRVAKSLFLIPGFYYLYKSLKQNN